MSNRSGGLKSQQLRPSQRIGQSEPGGHRVAAREADIKTFNNLLRERKRLNERQNEQTPGAHKVNRQLTPGAGITGKTLPEINPLFVRHTTDRALSDNQADNLVTQNSEQHLQITLSANITGAEPDAPVPKTAESIVSVIQRIVMNQVNEKEPRQWVIQLGIEGEPDVEISLEYLGKNEWRLGLSRDGKQKGSADSDSALIPPINDDLGQLYKNIEAGLKVARPGVRLSEIRVSQ